MSILLNIIQKEFLQIFRNKTMVRVIFILPLVQLIILVNAATYEMSNIKFAVVDNDQSVTSRNLLRSFEGSPFYNFEGAFQSTKLAMAAMDKGDLDLIIVMPSNFEKAVEKELAGQVQLLINGLNSTVAQLVLSYSTNILSDFNRSIIGKQKIITTAITAPQVNITHSFWYNPLLNYKFYMAPGILVILVTIIGMFLGGLNLVREKEIGTIEQLNVTPMRKSHFIISKMVPFLVIGLFDLGLGLLIAHLLYAIPVVGSLPLLFAFAAVYLVAVLSIGLLLSTISDTQQQVMFLAFFFLTTFILMSGIFTPVESMPAWGQNLNYLNPMYYFMRVIRMVVIKGSGLKDIAFEFMAIISYAVVMLTIAVRMYRKTT